jgi:hypothetical protein
MVATFTTNLVSDATKYIAIGLLTVSGVWARLNDFEEPRSATLMYHDVLEAFLCTSWLLGTALSVVSILRNPRRVRADALLEIGPIWLISSFQIFRLLLNFVLALRHGYSIHKAQASASEFIRAYYTLVEGIGHPDPQLRLTVDYSMAESQDVVSKDMESQSSVEGPFEFVWHKLDIRSFYSGQNPAPSDSENARNPREGASGSFVKSEELEIRSHFAQDWQGEFVRIEATTQPKTVLGRGRLGRNPYSQTPIAALTYTKQHPMPRGGGKLRSRLEDLSSNERRPFAVISNVDSSEYTAFVDSMDTCFLWRIERKFKRDLAGLEAWLRRRADMTISAALWKNRATIVTRNWGRPCSFALKGVMFADHSLHRPWIFVRERLGGAFLFSVEFFMALLSFLEHSVVYLLSFFHRRRMTHGWKKADEAISRNLSKSAVLREYCYGFVFADQMGWRISSDTRANLLNAALEVRDVIFRRALSDAFIFDALCTESAGEKDLVYAILVVTMHDSVVTLVNSTEERRQHQLVWEALSTGSNVHVVMQRIKKHLVLYVEVPEDYHEELATWKELLSKAYKGLVPMRVRWPSFGVPNEFVCDGKRWRKITCGDDTTPAGLVRSIRDTFAICPSALSATDLIRGGKKVDRLIFLESGGEFQPLLDANGIVSPGLVESKPQPKNVADGPVNGL